MLQKVEKRRLTNRDRVIHPLFVRITHWINAFAAIAMLMSGLRIYNASPLYDFRFPPDVTLGGWLAGALAWHFAVMWLLVINGLAYLAYGVFSGHFVRKILNIGAMSAYRNIKLEMKHLLLHGTGEYNIVQRVLYVIVISDVILLFFSGLAIWKPVQFGGLAAFLGGYEQARHIHFFGMTILVAFLIIHVSVAFAVKGTIKSMFTGRLTKGQLQRLERR
ncbi:cytochrome b/b6 domain-containing protein [Methylocystis sp. WRRC1]|uniref:cytochrome b/b6 domain-containing protein n=1 Tax=Methylocystis sp. WRRC1 TaxID=1732014 RepID=UPI001D15BD38|nr:cytochrome b/b6 domain-containing protein [Methylocystis sp. WRRC1]MCC3245042.1 cytochrome b/b6 domain-containing protein [Methylocystis sp. WRRC1]